MAGVGPGANHEDLFLGWVRNGVFRIDLEGRVWREKHYSHAAGGFLTCEPRRMTTLNRYTYCIQTSWDKKPVSVQVPRLVYRWFHGDIPEKMLVWHKNGIKTDDHPDNLALVDQDIVAQSNHGSKTDLIPEQVEHIRHLCAQGFLGSVIAEIYGLSLSTINRILTGKSWAGVSGDVQPKYERPWKHINPSHRECTSCDEIKPIDSFYKDNRKTTGKDGKYKMKKQQFGPHCRDCRLEADRVKKRQVVLEKTDTPVHCPTCDDIFAIQRDMKIHRTMKHKR